MESMFAIFIAALSLLACTMSATAVPGDYQLSTGSLEMSADNMAVGFLEVTDDQFPGVTFTGTAQSINEQMKALKPKAFSNVDNVEIVKARSLRERSSTNCNWGSDILGPKSCNDGSDHLKNLGNAKCCVRGELNHCALISCSYKCGVYLCNKRDTPFCAACSDIANDITKIRTECKKKYNIQTPAGALDFPSHFVGLSSTGC